jgi:non-lysosomal glucosylceramidase
MGVFPLAHLNFADPQVPLQVSMEAYNPFILLNPDDSSLPIAMFSFYLTNPTDEPVKVALFANLENKIGFPEVGGGVIEYFEDVGVHGLKWHQAGQGQLEEHREPSGIKDETGDSSHRRINTDVGSIGLRATVAPGETVRLPVWIVRHNPISEKYWGKDPKPVWKSCYAKLHKDAVAVAEYVAQNHERLERDTRTLAEALFSSTLPEAVLDAVSSQISILKTPTCIRLEDGTPYGWEGCRPEAGCCEGTCTHVWNYAQALPYLFPSLERSIREADYAYNLHDDRHMTFRLPLPLGTIPEPTFHAAADGQLGGIMKVYREWLICGDDGWLRQLWPSVKKALEYAWKYWDRDKDGVIEGLQRNTYHIEFAGPHTMSGSFYLGALRAAEEIAQHLGDSEAAQEYRAIYQSGRSRMDATLFNGEYYIQDVRLEALEGASFEPSHTMQVSDASAPPGAELLDPENPDYPKLQIGHGCLSDQLIGQWYARMLRLGDLFDPEHIRAAIGSVFRYNWRGDLSNHAGLGRNYALNDEAGLLVASWPRGGRPGMPTCFGDEVWCGIEYQVASHLIYEGFLEEGLTVRERPFFQNPEL